MDRPRHPHVVRTWVVERTRHPIHSIPVPKHEDARHTPVFGIPRPVVKPKPDKPKTSGTETSKA